MPAISVSIETIYACNLDFLNSFLTQDDHFQGVLKILRLQAYMVPSETEIAGIFGPYRDQDCRHIWSPS